MKRPRDKIKNHSRTTYLPEELSIAGQDYETTEDDPLRDEPSPGRQHRDAELFILFRDAEASYKTPFFEGTILVTSRMVVGEKRTVVVDGRRRVAVSRIYNEERVSRGLKPLLWVVEYRRMGDEALEVARVLNQGKAPETYAQKARYFARLVAMGHAKDSAVKFLGLPASAAPHLEAVASPQCAAWVFEALDLGQIGLQAAATVAARPPEEQARVLEQLAGRRPTTALVRQLVAGEKGTRATVAPPMRRVRELAKDPRLDPAFRRGVQFARGMLSPADVPELAGVWAEEAE